VRYCRQTSLTILQAGRPVRFVYGEIDHCCENFNLLDGWLDEAGLQHRGPLGHAEATLMRSRDIIQTVVPRLKANETLFLHPPGVDEACDAARASLDNSSAALPSE
jgi:aminoglycoside N3'-acetyltransferase